MGYYYVLTTNKWCDDYEDIPLYDSLYDRDIDILGSSPEWEPLRNFDFGNFLKTSVVVNYYNPNIHNYFCLTDEYYFDKKYYFIKSCQYITDNQYSIDLELDVFTTYFQGIQEGYFPESHITQGHYPRFYRDGNNYKFNVSADNPICQGTSQHQMRTTASHEFSFNWSSNATVANFCNKYNVMWVEVYLQPNHNFRFANGAGGAVDTPLPQSEMKNGLPTECSIISFPYSFTHEVALHLHSVNMRVQLEINGDAYKDFLFLNSELGGENYIYNIKLSPRPLFDLDVRGNILAINESTYHGAHVLSVVFDDSAIGYDALGEVEGLIQEKENEEETEFYARISSNSGAFIHGGAISRALITAIMSVDSGDYVSSAVDMGERFSFSASELKGVRKRMYEPKLLQTCKSYKLRDSAGNSIEYSPLWLNSSSVQAIYTEAFTLSNTNYYYRLKSSGLYPNVYQRDWHGVVAIINLSLNIANDNLGAFLVQNKNYVQKMDWLADNEKYMSLINMAVSAPATLLSGVAGSMLAGNPVALAGAAIGVGVGIEGAYLNLYNNKETARQMYNFNMLDAMNSVNTLRSTNDNLALPLEVNQGIRFYIDKMEAFEIDQINEFNKYFLYGYELNEFRNPYYFLAGAGRRKRFNYIQTHVEQLFINCPREAEKIIRAVLGRGARFWHLTANYGMAHMYDYINENYEIFIE